jgi:hypothetical protein
MFLLSPSLPQARGFTSFLRVGSLRAMSKAVLPHALHAADDSKGGAASDALKEMLKEAGGEEEAAVIRCGCLGLYQWLVSTCGLRHAEDWV